MKLFRFIEDRPLSPIAYVLYALLFSVPVVGFICVLVFGLGSGNQHRKNFARSWICLYIVLLIAAAIYGLVSLFI